MSQSKALEVCRALRSAKLCFFDLRASFGGGYVEEAGKDLLALATRAVKLLPGRKDSGAVASSIRRHTADIRKTAEIRQTVAERETQPPAQRTRRQGNVTIINIGRMIGSQLQYGSPRASQAMEIGQDRKNEIRQLLGTIKRELRKSEMPDSAKADIEADSKTIRAQLGRSKPRHDVVTECLMAVKETLEDAEGSDIAERVLADVDGVLSSLLLGG